MSRQDGPGEGTRDARTKVYAAALTPSTPSAIRLCLLHQIVPHYRVPVLERLSQEPGIALEVWSDHHQPIGSLEPAAGSYPARHVPYRTVGPFLSQPGFLEALDPSRFDAVIAPWNTRLLQLFPLLSRARRRGVALILWGHGYSRAEGRLRRAVRNAALRRATAGLLYNHATAKRLAEAGIDRSMLFVAPNSIDQAPIRAAREAWLARPADLAAFRERERIHDRQLAVFVSRLEPDKRVDRLIEAMALVRSRLPGARCVIIGRGSQLKPLKALTAERGLDDAITFAGAIYDDRDLAPWMLSAGCFAYPVAIGLSILHAFGYGLPVVTSDDIAAHNPEIEALVPGQNGLLYRDGDIEDFATCIERCMQDSDERRRLADGALATVTGPDGYTIEGMSAAMANAVRWAVASKRDQPRSR